jgi:hypothetical protein
MQATANLQQHEMVQVDLKAELPNFTELVLQTRRLRSLSVALLTKHCTIAERCASTGQSTV